MFTLIKKILFSPAVFFLAATALILTLNLTPLVLDLRHTPRGRTFSLVHNNTQDFFFYQSLFNEGAGGAWLTHDPYTTEPHKSSIIFSYFLWLGKIGKTFSLPPAVLYHVLRLGFSLLTLFSVFFLIYFLEIPFPRLTFIFFLFAAPFLHTVPDGSKFITVPYMNWWTGMDPLRRAAYLPHHMIGSFLLVTSVILLVKYFRTAGNKYLLRCLILSLPLSFIHPPSLFILLLILPPTLIIYTVLNFINGKAGKSKLRVLREEELPAARSLREPTGGNLPTGPAFKLFRLKDPFIFKFIGIFIYWLTGLALLIFMFSQTNNGFPWSQYVSWEKNLQFPLGQEIIGALGFLFPFAVIGTAVSILSKKFEYILVSAWLFIPILFIPLAPRLNLSNARLIQGIPYLPLAILAALGIKGILDISIFMVTNIAGDSGKGSRSKLHSAHTQTDVLKRKFGIPDWRDPLHKIINRTRILETLILIIISVFFLIFTCPTLSWSVNDQIREYWPIFGNVYLDNSLFPAFDFINQNYSPGTKTVASFYAGNYLPAYTHTTSFIGHFGYTYNVDQKQELTNEFFNGKMAPDQAENFLVSNKITLVVQGPEEKPMYNNYLYPDLLNPVYDKGGVTIYGLRHQ